MKLLRVSNYTQWWLRRANDKDDDYWNFILKAFSTPNSLKKKTLERHANWKISSVHRQHIYGGEYINKT